MSKIYCFSSSKLNNRFETNHKSRSFLKFYFLSYKEDSVKKP